MVNVEVDTRNSELLGKKEQISGRCFFPWPTKWNYIIHKKHETGPCNTVFIYWIIMTDSAILLYFAIAIIKMARLTSPVLVLLFSKPSYYLYVFRKM